MPRLRRSDPSGPGIRRRRSGKGFSYRMPDGTLAPPEDRYRIEQLAIPPAWDEVWISLHPNGHIQAVGVDAAGRSQYIYHPRWREVKDTEKFDRAARFGAALPSIRRAVTRDLRNPLAGRRRALAAAVRMMDLGALRIGSESYASQNGSYGLTTLRCRHVRVAGDVVELKFPGKSGQGWESTIKDAELAEYLAPLSVRKGKEPLLAYEQEGKLWPVRAPMVNDYLRSIASDSYSAKDFRTWKGTITAAQALAGREPGKNTKKEVAAAIRKVAGVLGNTPTIARNSYVDPRVIDAYIKGELVELKPTDTVLAEFLLER